jgi:hypothetical protein
MVARQPECDYRSSLNGYHSFIEVYYYDSLDFSLKVRYDPEVIKW